MRIASIGWIAHRELRSIFHTAIGWLVLTAFLLITGVFWVILVDTYVTQSNDLVHNPYMAQQMNLTDFLLLPFFGNCTVIVLMVSPALSMRLFSEEFKQHTMELLLTSPISTAEIVLGKSLGAVGYLIVFLLCTLHYPITLLVWGEPELGVLIGGYSALLLLGSSIIAMGMLFSSWTENQIVASVLTFGVALTLYILAFDEMDPDALLNKVSLSTHVVDLLRGALRLSDLAYFAGLIGVFLFATHQRLESFRWR